MISIIVAIASNNGIGKNNDLLWHIPEDLKRFKKLTMGQSIIMGKNTWFSLPRRPLPGRTNIVLTDDPEECIEGCISAYSIDDALAKCEKGQEIFIIGGGSIYNQFLEMADRLYITHVHKEFEADTFFPKIDPQIWKVFEKEDVEFSKTLNFSYSYITYIRKN